MTILTQNDIAPSSMAGLAGWESYFTTRDGALLDVESLKRSLSWRLTAPLRRAGTTARRLTGGTAHPDQSALGRLESRLRTVAAQLAPESANAPLDVLLERSCAAARAGDRSLGWLLFIAVSGAMPEENELLAFVRALALAPEGGLAAEVLSFCAPIAREHHSQLRRVELRSGLVSLVDFSARHGFNSGVQRFTREVSRRWAARQGVTFVAFNDDPTALRALSAPESTRLLEWNSDRANERGDHRDDPLATIVVPWQATLFLPEVPQYAQCAALAALARFSENRVVAFGHDAIPVASAQELSLHEPLRFGSYLTVLRHADLIVANSATSAEEFRGYADALDAQGLRGPRVTHILLPIEQLAPPDADVTSTSRPSILAVGSHEPRKNQIALIYAAEQLWREGLDFELVLFGGRGPREHTAVHDAVAALRVAGRPVVIGNNVTDEELAAAYRAARFTVFISLDEGYGLPVAESIAAGTPVLTTAYGSTAEIAALGGCLTVDPRDDEAVTAAVRRMLVDDELLARLRTEIRERKDDDWDTFSDRLWDEVIVKGVAA
jgi:glycosyltransferase involved in cell wall biosynthesis